MAYEKSESARNNFGKFIHQFQSETKTLIKKLERILIKLYRQNVSLLFNQTCLNERLLPNYIYIGESTDFNSKNVLIFVHKIDLRSSFSYIIFAFIDQMVVYGLFFKTSSIFALSRKIWRIKTQNKETFSLLVCWKYIHFLTN